MCTAGIVITKLIFDEVTRPVGCGFCKRVCKMSRNIFELLLYMSHLNTVWKNKIRMAACRFR